ncbi:MAG: caspase family protein [Cyanobacteria bacterium J06631_9]
MSSSMESSERQKQGLSRRAFLQGTGAVMAALGLSELSVNAAAALGISEKAKDYSQALAADSGRKLALLIGIDKYPEDALPSGQLGTGKLAGCKTDVALQKALLIHRFGFDPADIVVLTDERATREGIYRAVVDHLIDQATAGDTVVVHFSGYGAQVRISDLTGGQAMQRSLVPVDGFLPTEKRPTFNDISEQELKTLLKQVKTKNITTVLDAGFVDIAVPLSGGLRSRARSEVVTGQLPAPFPLLSNQRLAKESEPFPGTLIRGANLDDVVLERPWNDFNAGAFTYVLTQYLWSAPAPVTEEIAVARSQEMLSRWGGSNQQPVLVAANKKTSPLYSTPLLNDTRGEGVITDVSNDGKTATIWFGGMPPRVLAYFSTPTVVVSGGRRLKVRSRDGLTVKAKLASDAGNDGAPLKVGQPVYEAIRALPKNLDLIVALDSRLERIERVDATSALSGLTFVSSTSDTNLPADCLLGKPIDSGAETLTASLNPTKLSQAETFPAPESEADPAQELPGTVGYGLFSLTRSLIPGTMANQDEAIKPAIARLSSKLQALMALKILRLSENRAASQLPVRVTLERVDPKENTLLISRKTFSTQQQDPQSRALIPEIAVGSRVRYRIFNDGETPLYYTLINVDPRERLSAFCPVAEPDPVDATAAEVGTESPPKFMGASIAPGTSVAVPSAELDWAIEAPTGPVETYVVCTTQPLTNTFETLRVAINNGGTRINPMPEPLDVVKSLLSDISQDDETDAYTLDMTQWATINFTYRAV